MVASEQETTGEPALSVRGESSYLDSKLLPPTREAAKQMQIDVYLHLFQLQRRKRDREAVKLESHRYLYLSWAARTLFG